MDLTTSDYQQVAALLENLSQTKLPGRRLNIHIRMTPASISTYRLNKFDQIFYDITRDHYEILGNLLSVQTSKFLERATMVYIQQNKQ